MKVSVLGCSGGIGGSLRTTSLAVDQDILVDAGTGVGELSIEELARIDHVFLTHSHLDHVTSIPFMVDTVGWMRSRPLTVHGTQATLDIVRAHVFNWKIWPDFTEIPSREKPFLRFQPLVLGGTVTLGERRFTAVPANHVVPAVGYQIEGPHGSLVFTGDTTTNDPLWPLVNRIENLRYLIIETAFANAERELAVASKHLCPSMLAEELAKLARPADIFVTHLKPAEPELIMAEIAQCCARYAPRMLENGQVFEL